MNNVIEKIINNEDLEELLEYCENDLFHHGPIKNTTLEILSLIKETNPDIFEKHEQRIIRLMGLFFKKNNKDITDLQQFIMENYKESIKELRKGAFTPMQNEILSKIDSVKNYSFSAPTSTGKSFVFRYLIENAENDVMIVVPSRALINEFYIKVTEYVKDKETMVLTFVDDINKKYTKKHIFILTPERARDVFKFKHNFNFDFFLFDEAQLTNEKDERGIYYDGIVRRLKESFPNTGFIFAHPFIKNPEAQFKKNNFSIIEENDYDSYRYKNTGQLFISEEKDKFYIFGTDKDVMGMYKKKIEYDPIDKVLSMPKGCVLIYTAKSRIVHRDVFKKFDSYINRYCFEEPTQEMTDIIETIKPLIGAKDGIESYFVNYLKKGIVFHHGSMPLDVRILLEKFINAGYCKMCFATSTLAQGINMPFDLIYIDRFEASKKLLIRNIIGRAGRSSDEDKFDYGIIVVRNDNMSDIRNLISFEEELDEVSLLDSQELNEDQKEYRDAIKNNDFSDEFNLPNKVIERTDNVDIESSIEIIKIAVENDALKFDLFNQELINIYNLIVVPQRKLSNHEIQILTEANNMLYCRFYGIKFSDICVNKYKRALEPVGKYKHGFVLKYDTIPNTVSLYNVPLFGEDEEIDFDSIVYNTYDFWDKLIDLKLIDIYYVAFMKYYDKYNEDIIKNIALKIKYGTINEKEIMELRYGFSNEDFDWLNPVVDKIDENEIVFNEKVDELDEFKKEKISKFIV